MPKLKQPTQIWGLTGGLASGKSTVSQIFKRKRIPVICADEVAHDLVKAGRVAHKEIVKTFGRSVLLANKELDRAALASLVFDDAKAKKKLEAILHPRVRKELMRFVKHHQKIGTKLIVLDIPLLFESKLARLCDKTVCVWTTQKLQVERAVKLRGMNRKDVLARIKNQMSLREKRTLADIVIENVGTVKKLEKRVLEILNDK